jgi:RimJ/RimL family protein N-acetyltransferase
MIKVHPVSLEGYGVRLEPLVPDHCEELAVAAADGRLWELWFTSVPAPAETAACIAIALSGRQDGHMLPWVVRELTTGRVVGSTRCHDILPAAGRVEIGYTWYARQWQRSHVNTSCRLLLLTHGFEKLGCEVAGCEEAPGAAPGSPRKGRRLTRRADRPLATGDPEPAPGAAHVLH